MTRRTFFESTAFAAAAASTACQTSASRKAVSSFEFDEVTVAALQSGKYTARAITERYLARIAEIDKRGPGVNAVIEMNPDAVSIADALDRERTQKGPRGPLHGIPVLIKVNIDTADRM